MSETLRPAKEGIAPSSGNIVPVVMGLGLVLLPLIYVLSVGPVMWIIYRSGLEGLNWERFYWPLEWLHEHVEFTRPLLEWYVDLWR